jgi:catechol 2,3-dioxygenase-like lactoylglutathione lyase family enzyme
MPIVTGILETALYASDRHRTADFYRRLFGFATLRDMERLTALDVASRSVLLVFQAKTTDEPLHTPGGDIPPHPGRAPTHLAFSIAKDEVEAWRQRLTDEGVAVESLVEWPSGARSLYFRDPDQNLVELITPGFWSIY